MEPEAAQAVVESTTHSQASTSDSSGIQERNKNTFYKSEFVIGPASGPDAENKSRVGGRKRILEKRIDNSEVDFTGEIKTGFVTHIRDRVNNLIELDKRPAPLGSGARSYLDYLLESDLASGGERRLLEECTSSPTRDADNNIRGREIDESKIEEFLSTVDGYNFVAADMEQWAALSELGLNMRGSQLPEDQRRQLYQRMDVMFGKGGRIMDKLHWVNYQIPENIYRFFHATRFRFQEMDSVQWAESVSAMQSLSQQDRDYMRSVMGINVDAFDPATQNIAAGNQLPEALDSDRVLELAGRALESRRLFLKELGVDLDRIYTFEQSIMSGRQDLAMAPTLYYQRLLQEYTQEYEAVIAAGVVPNDIERVHLLNEVRARIKCQTLENYIAEKSAKVSGAVELVNLEKKIQERTTGRAALIERRSMVNAADREIATRNREAIRATQTELIAPLEQASQRAEDQANQVIETHRLPIVGDIEASIEDRINNTLPAERDQRINALRTELTTIITEISNSNSLSLLRSQLGTAENDKRNALVTARAEARDILDNYTNTLPQVAASLPPNTRGGFTPQQPNTADIISTGDRQAATYDGEIQRLSTEITRIETLIQAERTRISNEIAAERTRAESEITALRDMQRSYREADAAMINAAVAVARSVPLELASGATRLAEMQGAVSNAGANIVTIEDIRNLPIEDLMQRLENAVDPATGNPMYPDENQRFLIASFAKSELQGQDIEARQPAAANEIQALADISGIVVGGVQIGEQALLIRTPEALAGIIAGSGLGWTPEQTTQNLIAARHLVARRLSTRYSARLTDEAAYWDDVLALSPQAQEDIGRVIDHEAVQLRIVQEIVKPDKKEKIFSRAYEIANLDNYDLRERLVAADIIPADSTDYSEQERNKGLPAGYVEWIRNVYPEYNGATNEAELFNALYDLLPPQDLAQILNDEFTLLLGVGARPELNIFNALAEADAIGMQHLDRADFERVFIRIVNRIRQRANKI